MFRWIVALAFLLVPAVVQAQATSVSSYLAANREAGTALMAGGSVARETGHLALRWGFGMGVGTEPSTFDASSVKMNSELDAILFVLNPEGRSPLIPFASAGLGLGLVQAFGTTEMRPVWSYGGGVRAPLTDRLSLEGEMRQRQRLSFGGDTPLYEDPRGMEFRLGLSFRFGSMTRSAPGHFALPIANVQPISREDLASPAVRSRIASNALDAARDYLGTRYVWGGNTPSTGFDCSGFIRYVYGLQGVALPRVSRDQAMYGRKLPLDRSAFQPGDLLAFASDGRNVDHVALYLGDGRIIHASQSGGAVRIDQLDSRRGSWYVEHLVAARRVLE